MDARWRLCSKHPSDIRSDQPHSYQNVVDWLGAKVYREPSGFSFTTIRWGSGRNLLVINLQILSLKPWSSYILYPMLGFDYFLGIFSYSRLWSEIGQQLQVCLSKRMQYVSQSIPIIHLTHECSTMVRRDLIKEYIATGDYKFSPKPDPGSKTRCWGGLRYSYKIGF